ncbi:MAG: hypothetical protein A2998_02280 [Candidatus Staskawiczbacteria bacterium RIFCSPLOWO2_01_FULL_37_25b]|uniref:Uncharacterized protein n=2 Tax=Candidatus Staskawicziibacteriota TaxID=1817916 RepID=A0A1G2HK60_9BACT|nr:MAG: hypothetical protein A2812_00935 [Candidatus Staskawiczbacteria bacterium RIFCSPHIGHO2_01_FULL_36_16]OGZ72454.1 MAG: hypothetical protein A2998_02280 [Candidatus Staskawiczbacteria bacterium RIFCSPLOWO2_01_FULL_37_25b]
MQKEKGVSIIIGVMIIVVAAVLLFGGVFAYQYFVIPKANNQQQNPTACTEEAKVCPDGSSVGRAGPNCEFTECPIVDETAGWKTYKNEEYGFQIDYPLNWKVVENTVDNGEKGWWFCPNNENVPCPSGSEIFTFSREIKAGEGNYENRHSFGAKNGKYFYSYLNDFPVERQIDAEIYSKMLSTFKFTTPTNQTAGWKTYTNSEYGFEFKYPSEYTFYDSGLGNAIFAVSLQRQNQFSFSTRIYLRDGKTINQWISQDVGSDGVSHYSTFVKNINVDGTNGIIAIPVIVMGGKNYYTAIFPKDNYMFEILITSEFSKTPQETISLLDQIISTFKFTK